MPIIILIPAVVCIIGLFKWSLTETFLNVYLPVFALLPIYYYWKVAALPPIGFSEAVLFPLGVAILIKELPRWKPAPMDIALGLFIFTTYYADSLAERHVAAVFGLFNSMLLALVPYMAGKLLIEQHGARVAAVKRLVFLLFVAGVVSAYEYRMGQNPFMMFWSHFFPGETFAWKTQIRWGFGRVSGPFGQSELAGIVFLSGFLLALWLANRHMWEAKFARFRNHPMKKATIIAAVLGFTLLMTQARGPWLGCIMGLPIAFIGRARRTLRATVIVTLLVVVGGGLAYVGLKHYASGGAPTSDEQETAQYRQRLLDNYIPIAERGGPWGWGSDFPTAPGQGSIDNEYLFVALTQGWVGLACFGLIALETLTRFAATAYLGPTKDDRTFGFTLLGIFAGTLITLFTVFMGNQPYELFFLFAGWSQALPVRRAEVPQLAFQQVIT